MYPHIDLYRMFEHPKCAIHCTTEDEAKTLIHNIKTQFSLMAGTSWSVDTNNWDLYGKNTGYTLFYSGDREATGLSYFYLDWFRENNYEIVEFSELYNPVELEESEMPIESILGLN